jgi:hypothetical protein
MTKFSRLSQFGMTFKPLTESRGEELLTLYLEAFPVRTSQQQDEAEELTEIDLGCGHIWQELLARYDPATSLWKTPQFSLLGDYTEFSETWPRWGLMQDGVSYQRQTLVRHTSEIVSGLWRTPQAQEGMRGAYKSAEKINSHLSRCHQLSLSNQVVHRHLWPTPIAQDAKHSGYAASGPGKADKLSYAVVKWPTPTAHNSKETNAPSESQRNTPTLAAQAGGSLNPTWVEWLMGWPLGWTDLRRLETGRFQQWQQQHGDY